MAVKMDKGDANAEFSFLEWVIQEENMRHRKGDQNMHKTTA